MYKGYIYEKHILWKVTREKSFFLKLFHGIRDPIGLKLSLCFLLLLMAISSPSVSSFPDDTYPYPIGQNVANYVSLKLNPSNFMLGKTQVLNILENYDLLGFINGQILSQPKCIEDDSSFLQPNLQYLKWHRFGRLVKGWLTITLSKEVHGIVVGLNTAKEVRNALVHSFAWVYSTKSLALKQGLSSITNGTNSLGEYLRKFKTICDGLAATRKLVFEQKKPWWLLNGLARTFSVYSHHDEIPWAFLL